MHLLFSLPLSFLFSLSANDTAKPQRTQNAQNTTICASTLPFVAGRNATFTLFDGESRNVGKMVYQYDRTVEGNYRVERYDAYGRIRRTANGNMVCSEAVSNMDWTPKLLDLMAAYPNKELKIGENQLAYPATLTVGDALPDGAVNIRIADKGRALVQVTMRATERRVETTEQIRADGNAYIAYKITYLQTVVTTVNNQASVPVLLRQAEWVVPSVGIVKTATFHNTTGKILYSSLLNRIVNDIPVSEPVQTPTTSPTNEQNNDKTIMELPTDLPSIKPE
jgi:hypothetical protein